MDDGLHLNKEQTPSLPQRSVEQELTEMRETAELERLFKLPSE